MSTTTGAKRPKTVRFGLFCAYCGRVCRLAGKLLDHQRRRHFICQLGKSRTCRRPFGSLAALRKHHLQVHRVNLTVVPHSSAKYRALWQGGGDVVGMNGVTDEMIAWQQRICHQRTGKRWVYQPATP